MRRWLAVQVAQNQVADHWTTVVLDQPGGPVRIPLEAIKVVTVGNLSQVLDHRITRLLGRTAHVVRFHEGRRVVLRLRPPRPADGTGGPGAEQHRHR